MATKQVAKKKETELANMSMFEEDAGAGLENLGQEDLALPFLKLLQKNNATDFEDDDGRTAAPGDILNTVTGYIYSGKEGVRVIPCAYQRRWIEWSPIGDGQKAPVNIFMPNEPLPPHERSAEDNKEYITDGNGHYLEDTHNHFVLVLDDDGTASSALIAMRSTGLKKSKKWNSMIASLVLQGAKGPFQPPRYSHIYLLKTAQEAGKNNYTWHNWEITREGPVETTELYAQAKMFSESVSAGDVVVKHEKDEPFADDNSDGDVPF
jgi:hypothetical protein|tara:strand:+ start:105 stop:899 length:795 start_codon:yes stop_codon:yes gene_type:complete